MQDGLIHIAIHLPGQMPGLNEIIEAAGKHYRNKQTGRIRTNAYQETIKKPLTLSVQWICRAHGITRIPPSAFTFLLHEPDMRRDPDNAAGGARKVVLDAIVSSGLLVEKDGWRGVLDLRDHWIVDKGRVGVTLIAASRALEKEEAIMVAARGLVASSHAPAASAPSLRAALQRRKQAPARAAHAGPARGLR